MPRRERSLVLSPIETFRSELDRLFEEFFRGWPRLEETRQFAPPMDVLEDKDNIYVKVDLPGMRQEDVRLEVEGGTLTIRGKRSEEREIKADQTHCIERRYGEFMRQVDLPPAADPDYATASFRDGVLTVTIPKKPGAKAKTIEIQAAK